MTVRDKTLVMVSCCNNAAQAISIGFREDDFDAPGRGFHATSDVMRCEDIISNQAKTSHITMHILLSRPAARCDDTVLIIGVPG